MEYISRRILINNSTILELKCFEFSKRSSQSSFSKIPDVNQAIPCLIDGTDRLDSIRTRKLETRSFERRLENDGRNRLGRVYRAERETNRIRSESEKDERGVNRRKIDRSIEGEERRSFRLLE